MVGDDELDLGIFRGNDLPNSFQPHRTVHLPKVLHLKHKLELIQLR